MSQKSYDNSPTLYLVPTPIGNLEDITIRSLNILKSVEVIFSEDTRETLKLLKMYNIEKKLISYHKFNEDTSYLKIIDYLQNGNNIALVSDRGTPSISDPGYVATFKVIEKGFNVVCLPGATAFTPALVMSGINPNKFLFYGFLNNKKSIKKKELESLKLFKETIIFYESPFRIKDTLLLIKNIFGDRKISISREISKKFEEVYRGNISEIFDKVIEKGEFVLIIEGNKEDINFDNISINDHIKLLMSEGKSEKEAIKEVAKLHNIEKNKAYMEYHGGKKWN